MVNESAGVYEIHLNQVTTWKREAQEGLKALFERQRGRRRPDEGREVEALWSDRAVASPSGVVEKKSGLNPPG